MDNEEVKRRYGCLLEPDYIIKARQEEFFLESKLSDMIKKRKISFCIMLLIMIVVIGFSIKVKDTLILFVYMLYFVITIGISLKRVCSIKVKDNKIYVKTVFRKIEIPFSRLINIYEGYDRMISSDYDIIDLIRGDKTQSYLVIKYYNKNMEERKITIYVMTETKFSTIQFIEKEKIITLINYFMRKNEIINGDFIYDYYYDIFPEGENSNFPSFSKIEEIKDEGYEEKKGNLYTRICVNNRMYYWCDCIKKDKVQQYESEISEETIPIFLESQRLNYNYVDVWLQNTEENLSYTKYMTKGEAKVLKVIGIGILVTLIIGVIITNLKGIVW